MRNLDADTFLEAVIGNKEDPLTSTVNTYPPTWYASQGCCGCA